MSTTEAPIPPRMNAATLALYQHEERMAQAARSAEPSVSVELDANAKRETIPTVKLYAPMNCDLEALREHADKVREIAVEQYGKVTAAFPAASGFVTNDGKS
jgi:hypothetical protein